MWKLALLSLIASAAALDAMPNHNRRQCIALFF